METLLNEIASEGPPAQGDSFCEGYALAFRPHLEPRVGVHPMPRLVREAIMLGLIATVQLVADALSKDLPGGQQASGQPWVPEAGQGG